MQGHRRLRLLIMFIKAVVVVSIQFLLLAGMIRKQDRNNIHCIFPNRLQEVPIFLRVISMEDLWTTER
uniref:Uncharacterized protein n=1 Tax=Panstrongylus lignarius TaxID=156445 RepID=A0A224Y1H3_9HEMI